MNRKRRLLWLLPLWSIIASVAFALQNTSPSPSTDNMVMHAVFGVERDIEIPADAFPTKEELDEMERKMPGCEHGWFDSTYQGAKLLYRKWLPAGKPKGIIIYMHGIAAHSGKSLVLKNGRKLNASLCVDECVNKNGYAWYAFDSYGHGFSEGTRTLIPKTYENNVADYVKFINLVASQHDDDIPIFLMGESYGSTLTIHVAKQFQEHPKTGPKNFDSVILAAPAIIADMPPYPVYLILRYMLAPFFPKWIPFFMPNTVSPDRIWRDPEVRAVRTDKRYLEMGIDAGGLPFRLGTALNLVIALEDVRKKAIPGFKVPFCIIHGTEDYAVPIEGSEYMLQTATTPKEDLAVLRQEGAYHDLFADYSAEDSIKFVLDWMKKRTDAK